MPGTRHESTYTKKAVEKTLPRPRIGRPRKKELSPEQIEFLDWLVSSDPDKGSETLWAKDHRISRSTLQFWKRNFAFREAWWTRLDEMNVQPDKVQAVLVAMQKIASDSSDKMAVSAAKVYLDYVEKNTPKKDPILFEDNAQVLASMTDEELDALILDTINESDEDED